MALHTSTMNDLVFDPLFQLNCLLWLTQPSPSVGSIRPLLYENGLVVHAIAPLLALPPDVRLKAVTEDNMNDATRPDVVLTRERDRLFVFCECKSHSFSAASSNSRQARLLLAIVGNRVSDVLALNPDAVSSASLSIVLPEKEREPMLSTLQALETENAENGLPAGPFSVLGLTAAETHVSIVIDASLAGQLSLKPGTHTVIQMDAEEDPRPLYFIPYDPDSTGHQSNKEKAYCKRVLFERMLVAIIAATGNASPPVTLSIRREDVLNDALFGMFDCWENRESARHMRKLCGHFMNTLAEAVNSEVQGVLISTPTGDWRITLNSNKEQQCIQGVLTSFSCETLALRSEPEPDLFSNGAIGPGFVS